MEVNNQNELVTWPYSVLCHIVQVTQSDRQTLSTGSFKQLNVSKYIFQYFNIDYFEQHKIKISKLCVCL